MSGHLKSFVAVTAAAFFGSTAIAAIQLFDIAVTQDAIPQNDPAVSDGWVAYTEYATTSGKVWAYELDPPNRRIPVPSGSAQTLEDIDGTILVYSDDRISSNALDLYAFDVNAGVEWPVAVGPGYQTEPAISGNRVVWQDLQSPFSNMEIFVGCLDLTCSPTNLSNNPAAQREPAISGTLVAWGDGRFGGADIVVHDVATSNTVVIPGGGVKHHADVSGTRVVFDRGDSGSAQKEIWLYDYSDGTLTQITTNPGNQVRPRISGNLIIWEDDRAGNIDLYGYDLTLGTEKGYVFGLGATTNVYLHDVHARPDGSYDIAYTLDYNDGTDNSDIRVQRAVNVEATPTPPDPTPTPTDPTPTPTATPEPAPGDPCDPTSGAPQYFVETFERGHGQPEWEIRNFNAAAGPGTMCLTLEHVSSATVKLNDGEVFGPSAFNPNMTSARADISLQDRNELEVKLAGKPCDGDGDDDRRDDDGDDDDRCPNRKPGHGRDHDDGDDDGDDGDDDDGEDGDDDDDGECARMRVRIVGPAPAPVSIAQLVGENAAAGEAPKAVASNDGSGSQAGCSVSATSSATSPLAALAMLAGLVVATRRRRSI